MFRTKAIHRTVVFSLLLLPALALAGPPPKAPAAFERAGGKDRPLYTHSGISAFRGAKPAPSNSAIRVRDPESGIVVCRTTASGRSALKAAMGKQGFSEIPAYAAPDGRWVVPTDQLIVQFSRSATQEQIDAFLASRSSAIVRARRNHPSQFVVKIADPALAMSAALEWQKSALVHWAQANCLRQAKPRFIPNDTYFPDQWSVHNTGQAGGALNRDINAERAWDVTRGAANVIVAVLDDGFEMTHPDLAANVFTNFADPVNGFDDDFNGYVDDITGWDFWDSDNDPSPANSSDAHGVATAGLVIAPADNNEGIAGMANLCRLLPLRVASEDVVKDIDWADSIEYAARIADVISISYFIDPFPVNYEAIRYAVTSGRGGKGCVVCAAYGNDGVFRRYTADLATEPEVLGVSGNSNYDKRSWFGDYGPSLSVVGPAGGGNLALVTTDRSDSDPSVTNGWEWGSYSFYSAEGTSFSCPLAAGIAALLVSEHPDWSGLAVRRQIETTCDRIDAEAFPYGARGKNASYGFGRINAWAALATAPAPWDSYEPDDSGAAAKSIADGEMQYRSLATGADEDWVSFATTNLADFQLTVVGTTNAGLELYNAAQTLIATNTSGWPSYCRLAATNQAATTYYARVFSPPGVAISNYGLHFGILNWKDSYEPDNARASAQPIAVRAMQYHTLYPGTEEDWATFTLPRNASVKIWTMGEIGGDTTIELRNSGGALIATNDDGVYNAPYSYLSNSLSAATYYVRVREYYGDDLASYQLLIEAYDRDGYETNNAASNATAIASGQRLSGTIYPSGDTDWFRFTVSNRANALLLTDSQNPYWGGDTILTLYDSNLVELAQNDEGNNFSYSAISITNLPPGIYYAKVEGWSGTVDPDYFFSLDIYSSETRLTAIRRATNGVGIAWNGDASFDYRIEAATNLSWSVATNLEGRVGENRWVDPIGKSTRWYRVVAP